MNVLVLKPGIHTLAFHFYRDHWEQPLCSGQMDDYRNVEGSRNALAEIRRAISAAVPQGQEPPRIDLIALRGVFGGTEFRKPAVVTPPVVRQLEKLVPHAPLHIPPLLALVNACQEVFRQTPVVLHFETSFFVDLPEREHLYAVDPSLVNLVGLRRFGFHGILHAAAAEMIARKRRGLGLEVPARILSICLEARPEAAAVLGHKPLVVTSGATPLEGLPGQTTCGELDPSIVLMLAQKKSWGPEQINDVLTQQSGWMGLVGHRATLGEIFASTRLECRSARQLIQYRLLQFCGAGLAALGGVDAIVFSGRCSGVGVGLGTWLKKKLDFTRTHRHNDVPTEILSQPVERILGEMACAAAFGKPGDLSESRN